MKQTAPSERVHRRHRLLVPASAALGLMLMPGPTRAIPVEILIANDADDGIEVNDSTWVASASPLVAGRASDGSVNDIALRFVAPALAGVDSVVFARLRFSCAGGAIADSLRLTISGALEVDSPEMSQERRPSCLPRTGARVPWCIRRPWSEDNGNVHFRYSADLSGIVNEIIGQPQWGAGSPALILCLDDSASTASVANFVQCDAYSPERWPVTLQVARTLDEAFACHEALARPTDHSILVHFTPLVDLEAYVQYFRDGEEANTPPCLAPAGVACRIELDGLAADAAYQYRLWYRRAGSAEPFIGGAEHSFHTQRPEGSSFTFTTEADSHAWDWWQTSRLSPAGAELYPITQANLRLDQPDFHISLGDFGMAAFAPAREDAHDRYALQRRFLDETIASIPFYLALGNHEGELGWLRAEQDSTPIWTEEARLAYFPNPVPGGFYDGCPDSAISGPGLRQSYYSWEWGGALFVVLDPFWYTMERPHHRPDPDLAEDGWLWTLGQAQYEWFFQVLNASSARWKIVLLHHLVGGYGDEQGYYGRGGVECVKWEVAHRPTFEWGGECPSGMDVFSWWRPGWGHGPIHDMMAAAGVRLVIRGHDHFCAVQACGPITYLLCPQPADADYSFGALEWGGYVQGIFRPNSGHLRIRVDPDDIVIQYVRASRQGEGENGALALDYSVTHGLLSADPDRWSARGLRIQPNPAVAGAGLRFLDAAFARDPSLHLRVFDAGGRLRATLRPATGESIHWNARADDGFPLPSGVYWCVVRGAGRVHGRQLVLLR